MGVMVVAKGYNHEHMKDHQGWIQIGEVYREHGLRGEAKVYIYSGEAGAVKKGVGLMLQNNDGEKKKVVVREIRPFNRWFLMAWDAFSQPEEIKPWRKAGLWLSRSKLKKLKAGEYYVQDLIGYTVSRETGPPLGVFQKLSGNEDNPLAILKDLNGREILIPMVPRWIKKVDSAQMIVVMDIPEGLEAINSK